ncbi:unnamed protein product [Clonostachys rhizophaga]|uniref:Uncharacterized protein n=1 Tax=Clonostachys rhizophaga TaxID=160324 RepID=A0A9N9VLH5_9HYPO|nr:unnamed protein product [Clonostachys rhizophaga]
MPLTSVLQFVTLSFGLTLIASRADSYHFAIKGNVFAYVDPFRKTVINPILCTGGHHGMAFDPEVIRLSQRLSGYVVVRSP